MIECKICKKLLSEDHFYVNKRRKGGYSTKCKACVKEYNVAYRAAVKNKTFKSSKGVIDRTEYFIKRKKVPMCNCHTEDKYGHVKENYKVVAVDQEDCCVNCGHYAIYKYEEKLGLKEREKIARIRNSDDYLNFDYEMGYTVGS